MVTWGAKDLVYNFVKKSIEAIACMKHYKLKLDSTNREVMQLCKYCTSIAKEVLCVFVCMFLSV